MVSYGGLTLVAFHVVNMPLEIWETQDELGKIVALEIIYPESRQIELLAGIILRIMHCWLYSQI